MEYSRESSLKWILVYLVLGLAAYGAVYYFFFYKTGGNVYTEQNSQTQTAGWKTYANNIYNYQISYDPDAKIQETSNEWIKSSIAIQYRTGSILICLIGEVTCGNIPASANTTYMSRDIVIQGKKYSMNGSLFENNELLYTLDLPKDLMVYMRVESKSNITQEEFIDTEDKLLQMLSTLKFIK